MPTLMDLFTPLDFSLMMDDWIRLVTPPRSKWHLPTTERESTRKTEMHKHKCDHCGTMWKHDEILPDCVSMAENAEAHQCPSCGQKQYWKYQPYL